MEFTFNKPGIIDGIIQFPEYAFTPREKPEEEILESVILLGSSTQTTMGLEGNVDD